MKEAPLGELATKLFIDSAEHRHAEDKMVERIQRELAHGYDVQRWVKRLFPQASDVLLVAALLHDVERIVHLDKDKGFSGDRDSRDYENYKKQHARRSAQYAGEQLFLLGIPRDQVMRIMFLITHHDDTGNEVIKIHDPELDVLVGADSLSFFTSIAPDMLEREGAKRLTDKVFFMVEKMSPPLRDILKKQNFTDHHHGLKPEVSVIIERVKEEGLFSLSELPLK